MPEGHQHEPDVDATDEVMEMDASHMHMSEALGFPKVSDAEKIP